MCGVEHFEEKQCCGNRGLLKDVQSNIECEEPNVMPGSVLFEAERISRERHHALKERELQFLESLRKQFQS